MIRPTGFRARLLGLGLALGAAFLALGGRAFELTVMLGPGLRERADDQHFRWVTVTGPRGDIFDRHGNLLASSLEVPSIFAHPRQVDDLDAASRTLAKVLDLRPAVVRARLDSSRRFVWLERQVLPRQAESLADAGLAGIGQVREPKRFYPRKQLGAHVLGYVNIDARGQAGLELALDETMRGAARRVEVGRTGRGRILHLRPVEQAPTLAGRRVQLTLDVRIQDIVERELALGVERAGAVGGVAIVADPSTGEILALANVPTFDPNDPPERRGRDWVRRTRDQAVTSMYEPGSTLKAVLAATALETGVTTIDETFFCENGRYRYGDRWIHDSHPHGWLSFAEVIEVSSNICASKVATRLGAERYYRYLRAFGFGQRTGIELPGEAPGILRPVESWAPIDLATHSFGQGIAVTPLQMVAAFGAIANGGVLMRPYVVRRIVAPDGTVEATQPTPVRRVVSERAARLTAELLRRAVEDEEGTGSRARLGVVTVAGKTGTAQKPRPDGRGYSDKRIGSFIGFVPAEQPRMVILVLIDEPKTTGYGGVVAAPVFRAIAAETLPLLDIPSPAPEPIVPKAVLASAPSDAERRATPTAAAGAADDRVPSLLGLSLREALTRAHADAWSVDVAGFGYVAAQVPAPGGHVPAERRLALTLRADAERRVR
jgi:cell division protein FtsI (penicillin-binding protein 3)